MAFFDAVAQPVGERRQQAEQFGFAETGHQAERRVHVSDPGSCETRNEEKPVL